MGGLAGHAAYPAGDVAAHIGFALAAHLSMAKRGGSEVELRGQVKAMLADVYVRRVPGERDVYLQDAQHEALRDAILVVVENVQRLNELVTIEQEIEYCEQMDCACDCDYPLGLLDQRHDQLLAEIKAETPIREVQDDQPEPPHDELRAEELLNDADIPPLTFKPMASFGWGPDAAVKQMNDMVERWAREMGERIAKDTNGKLAAALRGLGFVPKVELDGANERITELLRQVEDNTVTVADALREQRARIKELEEQDASKAALAAARRRIDELEDKVETVEEKLRECEERGKRHERRIDEKTDEVNRLKRENAELRRHVDAA